MVQPIDYMSMIPQPDLGGAAIRFSSVLRQNRERDAAMAKEEEAKRQAAELQAQYRQDLEAAFSSGRPQDFAALISRYPQQREALAQSWDILDQGQRENEFREGVNIYQSLKTNPDFGARVLEERITAEQNAGNDTRDLQRILAVAKQDPEMAANQIALTLSSLDPDKWSKISIERRARDLEPYERTKTAAEAQKAAIESGFFQSQLALDLEQKGWSIENLMEDVETKRQNRKLAILNNKLGKTTDALAAEKLAQEIEKLKLERDIKVRDRVAEGESRIQTIDNSISTVDEALQFNRATYENIVGFFDAKTPTIGEDESRLEGIIETLQSQIFLNKVNSLKGPATDKDADELKKSINNLNLSKNDPDSLRQNVQRIQELLKQMRDSTLKQYGMPLTPIDSPRVDASMEELIKIINQEAPGFMDTIRGAQQTIQNPQSGTGTPADDGNLVREIFP